MLRNFLSSRGLNASKTRDAVVDAFLATQGHIDLQSLVETARRLHAGVSFATVYRTMKLLEEAGIATARRFGDARGTLFEVAIGRTHHDHLICLSCGRIVEFVQPEVERLQDEIAAAHGFSLEQHRHELYGTCATCRRGRRAPAERREDDRDD
jgi:Fur family ferric uptake transcriptional regulator